MVNIVPFLDNALAKAAFTAEDLQRYTELDEGFPAEAVARSSSADRNGPRIPGRPPADSRAPALGPLTFGEPHYRLPALKLLVRQAVVSPLVVDFAVHEDRLLVFIR